MSKRAFTYRIDAQGPSFASYLKEVNRYKSLCLDFAIRELKVRYAETTIGILWSIINPLINFALFIFIFIYMGRLEYAGKNALLYIMPTILIWNFFAQSVSRSVDSVFSNYNMIKKIYFPKICLSLGQVLANIPELVLFLTACLIYAVTQSAPIGGLLINFIPLIFISMLATAIVSVGATALVMRFRDMRFIIPVLIRMGMFVLPIGYGFAEVPEKWKDIFIYNPFAVWMEYGRSVFNEGTAMPQIGWMLLMLFVLSFVVLWAMKKMEFKVAELI